MSTIFSTKFSMKELKFNYWNLFLHFLFSLITTIEFLASFNLHHRPNRCSCPTAATKYLPSLLNLRPFTNPFCKYNFTRICDVTQSGNNNYTSTVPVLWPIHTARDREQWVLIYCTEMFTYSKTGKGTRINCFLLCWSTSMYLFQSRSRAVWICYLRNEK